MLLDKINQSKDLRRIPVSEYPALCREIRRFILEKVSRNGGHLSSNLGTVELTLALHLAFDIPRDKLIFDVGHQCYTHKLLTGRREGFDSLRTEGGLSGFPKKAESDCDLFDTGHSSTSISMALGLARARDAKGEKYKIAAVIGDGSLTGGLAFEALNNASQLKSNLVIVLNDNNMSIGRNIGGMSTALQHLRTEPSYNKLKSEVKSGLEKIPDVGVPMVKGISRMKNSVKQLFLPGMLFEDMDLTYIGPVDGHDILKMKAAFQAASRPNKPVIVHVITQKGKGYSFAEQDPERFHGIGPFDLKSGRELKKASVSCTSAVSESLLEMAETDPRLVTITAAMAAGTGLSAFEKRYPQRFFDVGIAEEHAISFASGLAAGGMKPYVCIYSTFLQRAYDQLIHDICLQKADVKLLIDRAGFVGADGETHQGLLDVGYLRTCPGMTIMAPRDLTELREMLHFSLKQPGPLAIRYPRGAADESISEIRRPLYYAKAECLKQGRDILLFAAGNTVRTALEAAALLELQGLVPTVVNARFIKPLDEEMLLGFSLDHRLAAVLCECVRDGGLGEALEQFSAEKGLQWSILDLEPREAFVAQGSQEQQRNRFGLTPEAVSASVLKRWEQMKDSSL